MFARLPFLRHGLRPTSKPLNPFHNHRNISFSRIARILSNPGPPILARYPGGQGFAWGIKIGIGFTLFIHIFTDYFYTIRGTFGISMQPTLAAWGDNVLISKYYRHGRGVQVGDIISFKHPLSVDTRASKRVIGMPGDFVLRDTPEKGMGMMIQVPEGHCWVVGDNLEHSRDSRVFGPLPLALVGGKVIARFDGWWPVPYAVTGSLEDASDMFDEYR